MYLEHFQLEMEPFALAPDSNFLFLSISHKKALVYLNYALWNKDSFMLITGAIGSGKTILLQRLLKTIPESTIAVTINQTQITPIEFLEVAVDQLGLKKPEKPTKAKLYKLLKTFFAKNNDKSIVFVIDEAQRMPIDTLEELRMLTSNDFNDIDININIILSGQPELRTMIESPELEQLNQRIRLKYDLQALAPSEAVEYIRYRLMRSGQTLDLFSKNSLSRIYQYTNGLPRKINMICDTALTCAFADSLKLVSTAQVDDSALELQWNESGSKTDLDKKIAPKEIEVEIKSNTKAKSTPQKSSNFEESTVLHLRNIEKQLSKIAISLRLISQGKKK